jgi:hypothetical protein
MTNQRICDKCKSPIPKGKDYCKLQWVKHIGKKLEYLGIGHLCINCLPHEMDKNPYEAEKNER